eukprot:1136228-Pelagomonas_calceolata.AAC.9
MEGLKMCTSVHEQAVMGHGMGYAECCSHLLLRGCLLLQAVRVHETGYAGCCSHLSLRELQ